MFSRPVLLVCLLGVLLPSGAAAASRDRDRDGLPDRWERTHHLKVGKKDAAKDPDRDGLTNRVEYKARTNPRRADTDRDGIKDGVERRCGTDPRRRTRRTACTTAQSKPDGGAQPGADDGEVFEDGLVDDSLDETVNDFVPGQDDPGDAGDAPDPDNGDDVSLDPDDAAVFTVDPGGVV
jgi:hypothetical protein